ncbi:MAG: signal recognition particle subunit, partial [Frankiaceae bacterium]|nr:signal recognition particle subunit [Frankiaceae bacterium]
ADFDVFHPERMASRILGMGDVLSLIEQAEQHFDQSQAEKMAGKLTGDGEFTLDDFLEQMLAVKKMGPIGNLLGLLPGMGQMKEAIKSIDDKDLDRIAAIIRSMTPAERHDPKMINGSRRLRIAKGSGVQVNDVNQLVDRFFEARKMMKQMAGGLLGGGRRPTSAKGKKGKKGKGSGGGGAGRTPGLPRLRPEDLANLQLPPGVELPTKFTRPPDGPR